MDIQKLIKEVLLFTVLALFVFVFVPGEAMAGDLRKRPTTRPVPPKETGEKEVTKNTGISTDPYSGTIEPIIVRKDRKRNPKGETADGIKNEKQGTKSGIVEPVIVR